MTKSRAVFVASAVSLSAALAANYITLTKKPEIRPFQVLTWDCQAGLNRSGLVTALLLIKEGRAPEDAIDLIRNKRDRDALCNAEFAEWLLAAGQEFFQTLTTSQSGLADW